MKKPRSTPDDKPGGLTHNPFAALRPGGQAQSSAEPAGQPASAKPPEQTPAVPANARRILVQREKKGRAGKTMTRVTGLPSAPADLPDLAREMKRALGCGAAIEEGDILLQGAQTERAAKWLGARFDAEVTIGN